MENDDFLTINFNIPVKEDEIVININPEIELETNLELETNIELETNLELETNNIIKNINIKNDYFKTKSKENSPSNKDNDEWIEI